MVGRGTDERLAGLGPPEGGDVGRRLAARQLAALAGLAALGDLDLELVGVDEVLGGHAEAGRRDLLDPGVAPLAVPGSPATRYSAGSSPPSPVLAAPPARWMPRVTASCASGESAPRLMAAATKRRTIAGAGSTRRAGPAARSGASGAIADRGRRTGRRAVRPQRPSDVAVGRGVGCRVRCRLAGPGERLDAVDDRRGVEVALAVGAEPGEPGVRQFARSPPASPCAASRRRSWRSARSPRSDPARPGRRGREAARHDGRVELDRLEERAADVRGDRADAHPGEGLAEARLEARRRGSPIASPRRRASSAPRAAASSAASSMASHGTDRGRADGEEPSPAPWMSRTSAASTSRSVRPRRPARSARRGRRPRRGSTGSAAGRATKPRSSRTMSSRPGSGGGHGPGGEPVEGALQAGGPVARGPRGVQPAHRAAGDATATRGCRGRRRSAASSRSVRGPRGGPPSSAGRRPSSTARSMTARSRSGSIGGFVTWANAWRRWSATGRSSRPWPGVGVSSPMLQSGSCPSSGHRLDVLAEALGVEPGQVAQGGRGGIGTAAGSERSAGEGRPGPLGVGRGRVVDRQRPRAAAFASASSRISRRPGRQGASRPARADHAGRSRPPTVARRRLPRRPPTSRRA